MLKKCESPRVHLLTLLTYLHGVFGGNGGDARKPVDRLAPGTSCERGRHCHDLSGDDCDVTTSDDGAHVGEPAARPHLFEHREAFDLHKKRAPLARNVVCGGIFLPEYW